MKFLTKNAIAIILVSLFFGFAACEDPKINEGNDAEFTHFEFVYMIDTPMIDRANKTIIAKIDSVVNVTNLTPSFVLTNGATAYIKNVEQKSGVTENDFSTIVTYTIVSENKKTVNEWKVIITRELGQGSIDYTDYEFNKNVSFQPGIYYMNGNITIANKIYFMLNPGVTIILGENSKFTVGNQACFMARGTSSEPIIFTSETSEWAGFIFNDVDEAEFHYCKFDNAGQTGSQFMQVNNNSNIGILHSEFKNINCTGILLDNNTTFRVFDNNTLINVGSDDGCYPIRFKTINSTSNLGENNSIITDKGIYIENGTITSSITLFGQTCPYIFEGDIRTSSVTDMTFFISNGVTIYMNDGKGIYIGNSKMLFKAEGTEAKPVIFKGNTTENIPGFWNGFTLNLNILEGSNFTYCHINDAGNGLDAGAIKCDKTKYSNLTIQHCNIKNTKSHGIYLTMGSDAKILNNNIEVEPPFKEIKQED